MCELIPRAWLTVGWGGVGDHAAGIGGGVGEAVTEPSSNRSFGRLAGWLPASALVLSLLLSFAFVWLWVLNLGTPVEFDFGNRATPLVLTGSGLVFAIVGWLITSRRPGNKVGWVALGIGVSAVTSTAANEYAVHSTLTLPGSLPGAEVAGWLGNFIWVFAVGLLASVLVLLFPDGHLPTPRWRGVMIAALVGITSATFYFAFAPGPLESLSWIENPLGIAGSEGWIEFLSLGFFLLAATVPLAAWSMRRRYRVSQGEARAQIRWFAAAAALVALTYVGQFVYSAVTDTMSGGSDTQRLIQTLAVLGFGALGTTVGIAVMKHRLYEIDRIISRTVTYVLVVGLLGVVVLVLVAALALFVPSDDPLVVAAVTLAVFALFGPMRRRVFARVDRRFNRSRYDAERVIDDFTGTLRERVDPESVVEGWVGVVSETMQPASLGVWVRHR